MSVVPVRDAEELAEALDWCIEFLRETKHKTAAHVTDARRKQFQEHREALSRFRSKYPKEDTDG